MNKLKGGKFGFISSIILFTNLILISSFCFSQGFTDRFYFKIESKLSDSSSDDYVLSNGIKNNFSVEPSGDASNVYFYGEKSHIAIPSSNMYDIGGMTGNDCLIEAEGSASIGSLFGAKTTTLNKLNDDKVTNSVTGIWGHGVNYSNVENSFYGLQANVDSWGGTINVARAGRFRLQNCFNEYVGKANPTMNNATVVYANIDQGSYGDGNATITNATGFRYDLNNGIGGKITHSYGIYLSSA